MNPDDELKRAWQSQFSGRRLVFNEDLILRQFRRQQSELRGALYGADVLMVLIAFAVLGIMGYAFYLSRRAAWGQWAVLIMVLPIAGFAAFTIVDRIRHLRRHPKRDDSVKACLESMLAEVHHRTWLPAAGRHLLWGRARVGCQYHLGDPPLRRSDGCGGQSDVSGGR